jgi:hypothetical protein
LLHSVYCCRCPQQCGRGFLLEFRKCLTQVSRQPPDFCRINLGLKVADLDALESGQPRAEKKEAD